MAEPAKINLLLHLMYWGPLETFILNQLYGLPEIFHPSISALHHYGDFTGGVYKGRKVEILNTTRWNHYFHSLWQRINLNRNKYAAHPIRQRRLMEIIDERKPDIIHAHYGQMGLNILPVAIAENISLVTTFHGNDASSLLEIHRYKTSLPSLFEYKKSYIITVSESIRNRLIGLGASRERIFCHYIGTNTDEFQPEKTYAEDTLIKKAHIRFLQVSNFVEKKGHIYTLQAFSRLARKYSNVFLILVGDGPTRKYCESRLASLHLKDRVKFTGKIKYQEVKNYMKAADIFVHNSITPPDKSQEGIPTVIMEAMACGLPVLSTYHAGIPELVEDGINGFLAGERDVDQYVENMERILRADWQKMSYASRKIVKRKFDLFRQNKKLGEIYAEIVQNSVNGDN